MAAPDTRQPIFYPRFSDRDFHLLRSPGPGLGNLLFPWARAQLLARAYNGRLIAPTWRNIKLGPLLRRENDLRTYGDLFWHRSPKILVSDLVRKLGVRPRLSEDEFLSSAAPGLVFVEGMREYFADLGEDGLELRRMLEQITRNPPRTRLGGIALHIRLGDFSEAIDDKYRRNSRVALDWFVAEAIRLRDLLGEKRITLFTDDQSGAVERAFRAMPNAWCAPPGNAIQDILLMSTAEHIVCSNSTFSLWATFLSNATFSARYIELFHDYRFAPDTIAQRGLFK